VTLLIDTGVFSAAISRRRPPRFESLVAKLLDRSLFLAPQVVAELRFGALLGGWGTERHRRLEEAIGRTTVVPLTDGLLSDVAKLRFDCRRAGHALADPVHANDLWIAACAVHINAELLTDDGVFDRTPNLRFG
jgi:predicted nucleic acid-binding protein